MYSTAAVPARFKTTIEYDDRLAQLWVDAHGPCRWQGKVKLRYGWVEFASLEPAGSWKRPEVVENWLKRMRNGRRIPPPVVCATGRGTWYLHDGNHRQEALEALLGSESTELVRIAELVPVPGYYFRFVQFREYGTYMLFHEERILSRDQHLIPATSAWQTPALSLVQ